MFFFTSFASALSLFFIIMTFAFYYYYYFPLIKLSSSQLVGFFLLNLPFFSVPVLLRSESKRVVWWTSANCQCETTTHTQLQMQPACKPCCHCFFLFHIPKTNGLIEEADWGKTHDWETKKSWVQTAERLENTKQRAVQSREGLFGKQFHR